jgi:hypothetical protein
MSAHASAGRSHCQNCGSPLSGPYCSACGQHDVDYHRSVWPILEDSLEGFLHFDGKFFRTVRWLFTRPGFLTNEFNAGKRSSYTQPIRLYIFASFLYFAATVFFSHPPHPVAAVPAATAAAHSGARTAASDEPPPVLRRYVERLNRGDPKDIAREMQHLVPTMAFFCLPILASLLLLAYRRSGRVYVEHLIFALHVQAFFFLAALSVDIFQAGLRLVSVSLASLAGVLGFVGGACLVYRAFRVVYGAGRWRTVGKVALVGAAYGVVLIIGISLAAITAALLASGAT